MPPILVKAIVLVAAAGVALIASRLEGPLQTALFSGASGLVGWLLPAPAGAK